MLVALSVIFIVVVLVMVALAAVRMYHKVKEWKAIDKDNDKICKM